MKSTIIFCSGGRGALRLPERGGISPLLRSGLWGIPADPALFPGQADWEAIVVHSVSQAVPALVAEGAHVPVDPVLPVFAPPVLMAWGDYIYTGVRQAIIDKLTFRNTY